MVGLHAADDSKLLRERFLDIVIEIKGVEVVARGKKVAAVAVLVSYYRHQQATILEQDLRIE